MSVFRKMTPDPIFCVVAVCLLMCLPLVAQDQPPATFRGGTSLRVVTVTVTDQSGKPIEGLTADDFVVTEDNVPQTVSLLEYERLDETLDRCGLLDVDALAQTAPILDVLHAGHDRLYSRLFQS